MRIGISYIVLHVLFFQRTPKSIELPHDGLFTFRTDGNEKRLKIKKKLKYEFFMKRRKERKQFNFPTFGGHKKKPTK